MFVHSLRTLHSFSVPPINLGDPECHDSLDHIVDDLHTTEDGEASQEPHGASYQAQLGFHGHLHSTVLG